MFCLYISSKLYRPKFEFSLKVKVMGSNPGYLLKSFLLQQTNGKKWFEMFLCMNSIYAPTFRQISTKLAMRQLKIQKFQASFQLAQLEFFTTNVSKFLCVRARNVSSILSTFAVLLQNLLVKYPLIKFIFSKKATKIGKIFTVN